MSGPRLVHMGGAVVDFVYRVGELPAAGTERVASAFDTVAGGGFNAMAAAARTGMRVAYGGGHGAGPHGAFLRQALDVERIACLRVPTEAVDSGTCVVLITDDAERTFVSWPGAEGIADAAGLARIVLVPGDWIFASGYTLSYPGSRTALASWLEALPAEIPLVFDPSPVVARIPPEILTTVLRRTTWLSCNSAEAAAISGIGEPESQAEALIRAHCPNASGVVVRAGAGGCFLKLHDRTLEAVPGFEVAAVDTNGAGDTHVGAFVGALGRGANPIGAARYANAAAAISVTRHGGSNAPTDAEIEAFLQRVGAGNAGRPTEEREAFNKSH